MALKTVYVELVAKTKDLVSGFKKVDKKTSALTKSFKRMGAALIAAFGARAVFRGFNQTIKATEALTKTAKGVGFTATEYERLTFALSEVGVEASSARIALGDFQKRLSKAIGGSSPQFAKAFKEAGLDIKALSQMSPAAAFDSAFTHLAGMLDDPRIAGLFGNVFEEQSGKDMLKAARQMEKLLQARKDYDRVVGRGLTKEDTRDIEEMGRQTRLLGLRWTVLKREIAIEAAPKILAAMDELEEHDAFTKMAEGLILAGTAVAKLIIGIEKLRKLGYDVQKGVVFTPDDPSRAPTAEEQRLISEHLARRGPGGQLRPSLPTNAGNISHVTIDNVFNITGVRDKDVPAKTGQAVYDAQVRDTQAP